MVRDVILYPCYFDAGIRRKEGRRISRSLAVKDAGRALLVEALKKGGFTFRVEDSPHPAHWFENEGRVVVSFDGPKTELIRRVAHLMRSAGRG
ncbi:MAG: signal recognition particle subunit SRP19/SEC65 family protein [Methanoculleaceae archaeon]